MARAILMHGVALAPTSTREEWLAQRRDGIGGSDAAAIAGLDRYRSPLAVWVEKTEKVELVEETNDALEWGHRLEGVVREKLAEDTGTWIEKPEVAYAHPQLDWVRANLDGFVWSCDPPANPFVGAPEGVAEIKTTSRWRADEWEDSAPLHVQVQAMHQLAVTGLDYALIAVLVDGRNFRRFRLERNEQTIEDLLALEHEFWHDHVLAGVPPVIDGSDSTSEALRRLYADVTPASEVVLPEPARAVVAELRTTKALIADMKRDEQQLANQLQAWLGENEVGTLDGDPVVTWRKGKERAMHNCPDCPHMREGSRSFRVVKARA